MAAPATPPPPAPARVLIIGAGYAGAVCASTLAAACEADAKACAAAAAKQGAGTAASSSPPPPPPPALLEITLVDPRDHLDSAFTHARSLVEPSIAPRALLPFEAMTALPPGTVRRVRAAVVALSGREARLSDGAAVPFDFAVVATGSSYAFGKSAPSGPATGKKERLEEINQASGLFVAPLAAASSAASASAVTAAAAAATAPAPPTRCRRVLVVGGGPLGVEVAAELLTDAPGVELVTLVQSSGRLLPSLPSRAGSLALGWLTAGRGGRAGRCRVVLGRRVKGGDPLLLAAEAAMRGEDLPAACAKAGLRVVGGVVLAPEGGAVAALEQRGGGGAGEAPAPAAAAGGGEATDELAFDAAIVATGILRNTGFLLGGALGGAVVGDRGEEEAAAGKAPPPRSPAPPPPAGPPPPAAPRQQRGAVRVDPSLRVAGFSNVFAAGDCTDVPEEKLAFLASSHGELVAKNVLALARARRAEAQSAASAGKDAASAAAAAASSAPPPLKAWKPSLGLPVAIVTLGRAYAIMCVGPVATAGWLPTKLKASNLLGFVDKYRTRLGVGEGVV